RSAVHARQQVNNPASATSPLTSSRLSAPPHSSLCPNATLAAFPLRGRFEESLEAFHHLGAVAFAFGGGNLSLQAPNGVRASGRQRLFNLFPNRAEFFCSDHNSISNRSHKS